MQSRTTVQGRTAMQWVTVPFTLLWSNPADRQELWAAMKQYSGGDPIYYPSLLNWLRRSVERVVGASSLLQSALLQQPLAEERRCVAILNEEVITRAAFLELLDLYGRATWTEQGNSWVLTGLVDALKGSPNNARTREAEILLRQHVRSCADRLSALAGRPSTGAVASASAGMNSRARRNERRAHLHRAHAAANPAPAPATPQLPLPAFDMASVVEGLTDINTDEPVHGAMPFRPARR